jgi:serine/threonine-protein kinase
MQTLGKYQLGPELGQGGMGAVYRSFHPQLGRPVAIKLIRPDVAQNETMRQRFLREAQLVAGLSHPGIINILDVDDSNGQLYIVTDLIEGGSLAERISSRPMPISDVLRIAVPLAEALDYAHREGVVHRDLKPSNVLLRLDGSPVLADFGIARPMQGPLLTNDGSLLGTIAYMAPEQIANGPIDGRTDLYAFGVMLFEMLAGRLPFEGDTGQIITGHLQRTPPDIQTLNPTVPQALCQLVTQLLAKQPDQRPHEAATVATALRSLSSGGQPTINMALPPTAALGSVGAVAPSVLQPTQPRRLIPILALLAVLIIGGSVFAWSWFSASSRSSSPRPTILIPTNEPLSLPTNRRPESTAPPENPNSPPAEARVPLKVVSAALPKQFPLADLSTDLQVRTTPAFSNPQPAGPGQFSVGSLSAVEVDVSSENIYYFYGEVRNDSTEAQAPRIRISTFKDNVEVASETGVLKERYLAPGEVGAFFVLFNNAAAQPFDSYTIEIRNNSATFEVGYDRRQLEVVDLKLTAQEFGGPEFSGFIVNQENAAVQFPQVYIVLYGAEDQVVAILEAFGETSDDNLLAAQARARFSDSLVIASAKPTSYRIYARASAP